jgi:hypothetical protein
MRRRFQRALDNRGVPIQQNIIDMVVEKVREKGRPVDEATLKAIQFTLQIPFRSFIWSTKDGQAFTPPAIEYGLRRAEKRRLPTTIPVKFRLITKRGGGGHFRRARSPEGKFPYTLNITVNSWGDSFKSTLTHELTHLTQYIGTALLQFADAPSDSMDAYRASFEVDMSAPLYGIPKREIRTSRRQSRTLNAGRASREVRRRQHAMLDQEYQTNAQSWADRFLHSMYWANTDLRYRNWQDRTPEYLQTGLPKMAAALGRYLHAVAAEMYMQTSTKRWHRQSELVYQWVCRRLGVPEADCKVTAEIRAKLQHTPSSSKTFQERKAARSATQSKPKTTADRGRYLFVKDIDGKQVLFYEGDRVEFNGKEDGEDAVITGDLIGFKGGKAQIEQDDTDSVWGVHPIYVRPIREERTRKVKAERQAERKARLEMRSKRKAEMGLTRPARPARTAPLPRPSPVAPEPQPEVREPIFAYLDRKLAPFRKDSVPGEYDAVLVPLGLSNPQLLSWIYNAAAIAGANPQFSADWPYDLDEPKSAASIRAKYRKTPAPSILDVPRILLATSSYVGLVTTNLDTRQTVLRLSQPYGVRLSQRWFLTVVEALREYGLQGARAVTGVEG